MKTKIFLSLLAISLVVLFNSCDKNESADLKIGDFHQGGIIVYIFDADDPGYVENETHGIIVSEDDINDDGLQWYNGQNVLIDQTDDKIGSGKENTDAIIESQGAGSYAAKLCADLVLNNYSDWYLPSMDELNQIYLNRTYVDNLMGDDWYYWSSTEYDSENAWAQCLYDGDQRRDAGNKSVPYLIRAVRTF